MNPVALDTQAHPARAYGIVCPRPYDFVRPVPGGVGDVIYDLEFAGGAGRGGVTHGNVVNLDYCAALDQRELAIGEADHDAPGGFVVLRFVVVFFLGSGFDGGDHQERRDPLQFLFCLRSFHAWSKGIPRAMTNTLMQKELTNPTACLHAHMRPGGHVRGALSAPFDRGSESGFENRYTSRERKGNDHHPEESGARPFRPRLAQHPSHLFIWRLFRPRAYEFSGFAGFE